MSSDIAIKVEKLSKCYHIYDKPRDRLMQMLRGGKKKYFREFWALKNVSFEIKKGETVGIVGRNGSGKSTLLQLICGTLNATDGNIQVNGRVAALLELGAGFNPEFTGRENVYMAASLYGLSTEDVDIRFDAISRFADIGDFINQPVKTYSSGMYVRLAFAVIAHVDADILVVDEALSVGDAVFTQKCMNFIRHFQKSGTLLFVSHDLGSVLNLCQTALWLGQGELRIEGESKSVVDAYLQYTMQEVYGDKAELVALNKHSEKKDYLSKSTLESQLSVVDYEAEVKATNNLHLSDGWTTGAAEILDIRFALQDGGTNTILEGGECIVVSIKCRANKTLEQPIIGFLVRDRLGQDLFGENTLAFTKISPMPLNPGEEFIGEFCFRLPMLPNGDYAVMASVADGTRNENVQHHYLHQALVLSVTSSKVRYGLVGVPFQKVSMRKMA